MHIDPPSAPPAASPLPVSAPAPRALSSRAGTPAPAPSSAPAPAGAATASTAAAAPSPSTTTRLRATGGDFDAARVAQLREAIASGRHTVDLGRVADGLIRHLNDLGGPKA